MSATNALGTFLRNRRNKLDPAAFGLPPSRRRTPGLRREEVAQRANISATWYTWLEQGRSGNPSPDVLERLSGALRLSDAEREHLFLLGLGHPPEARYRGLPAVSPQLQRLLDTLTHSPAFVRTATWDVVAWNRAATVVLTDYGALPPERRNILRLVFGDSRVRAMQPDWQAVARFLVSAFRADAARAGADGAVGPLVDELCRSSAEFAALWQQNDVESYGTGLKQLQHPAVGPLSLEYSSFALDAQPELGLVVYNPATSADRLKVDRLLQQAAVA